MNIKPEITVKNKPTGEKILYRMDQTPMVIGRDSSNFIVLPSKAVSRHHTEILYDHGQFFVRDLKSNNGTKLGERKLPPKEKNLLKTGDVIRIEDFEIFFEIPRQDYHKNSENTDSDLLEIKMVKKLLRAMDKESAPSLEILDGAEKGKRFLFEGKSQDVLVGRDPACELFIDSTVISRKHARFEKRFDSVTIHDLESKNGVFVNRQKITEKRLQDGDVIHLGTLAIIFRNPQELGLDVSPPVLTSEADEDSVTGSEHSVTSEEPKAPQPEARVAKRRDENDPPPPTAQPLPQPVQPVQDFNEPSPQQDEEIQAESSMPILSTSEIAMIVVGLTVLVGALIGLLKILK